MFTDRGEYGEMFSKMFTMCQVTDDITSLLVVNCLNGCRQAVREDEVKHTEEKERYQLELLNMSFLLCLNPFQKNALQESTNAPIFQVAAAAAVDTVYFLLP